MNLFSFLCVVWAFVVNMIAILADDLTGAADCAARSRHAGLTAAIALHPPPGPLADVTAFTSDSRHLQPAAAAEQVRGSIAAWQDHAGVVWYKKIDSTLRGNPGGELDAALDALDRAHAVICPAFPAHGRGLQNGSLVMAGAQPLLHLPTLLEAQSCRPVAALSLADVRAGAAHLAQRLAQVSAGAALLVVDAMTDDDLRCIVAATERALPAALLCGSAGLLGALAERHAGAVHAEPDVEVQESGPALLVIGSGSAVARRQIAHLRQHGVHVDVIGAADWTHDTGDTLICLPEAPPHLALDGPEARRSSERLADAAAAWIARHQPGLLVLSGGDTAMAVLRRLHVERLDVLREVLPGMPLAEGRGADGRRFMVVLKAGSHGDERALVTILHRVRDKIGR
jgi:uncharacterized protein YgbK (DUF1537 family)